MRGPVRLTPSPREKVWGRMRLSPWSPDSDRRIGEVWYLAEEELPLLVKLLFTSERLSVQVHPDDGEDGPRGKTEMWHILEAGPDAAIALGFCQPISHQRLLESTQTGEIEKLLRWIPVKAGETYFTPAHTVHAIGGGIVLCEIQQNSDVTYRLWDYGRGRELHVAQALAVSNRGVHPGRCTPVPVRKGCELLVRSKHFVTEAVRLEAGETHQPSAEHCQLWICLEGRGTIAGEPARLGEVWLLPDTGEQPLVRADTTMRFLRTHI